MSKLDKVMYVMRSIIIAIAMIVTCTVGMAYLADDALYYSDMAVAIAIAWMAFSGYKVIRWTVTEIKETLKK